MATNTLYEVLRERIRKAFREGRLSPYPTDEQRADWAFGNTAIENPEVTREMAEDAVKNPGSRK